MIEKVNGTPASTVNTKQAETTKTEEQKDNKLTKTQKIVIGATAAAGITAATIGGILYSKGKTLSKEIDKLAQNIRRRYQGLYLDEKIQKFFDMEKITQHIDDALKLPKKKDRLAKLQEIDKLNDRGLARSLEQGLKVEQLPKNIQEAIANKDHITATKLYNEYCDTLFAKSETAGATIEESIENIFGKGSIVSPHTYTDDVELVVMNNYTGGGGYGINAVFKNNSIPNHKNYKAYNNLTEKGSCTAPGHIAHTSSLVDGLPAIRSGTDRGRTFVTISYGNSGNGSTYGFTLFGKKGSTEFTKAQKDLMELDVTNLTKEQIALLSKLPRDGKNANYDAVLSLVQTLVEKAKCVF